MSKHTEQERLALLAVWRSARATGLSQEDFCKTSGLSTRTLRAWIAAEGTPKTSARQVEVMLRRMGQHLLQAAEELAGGGGDSTVASDSVPLADLLGFSDPIGVP